MQISTHWNPSIFWSRSVVQRNCPAVAQEKPTQTISPCETAQKSIEDLKELVRQRFGTTSSSPAWDLEADLNQDGAVNVLDKVVVREMERKQLVRQNFGNACTDCNFDSSADVNGDGVVNVLDKVAVRNRLISLKA